MNCQNCGATMRFMDGRGYFVCDYCSTFCFPGQPADSVDGVTALGGEAECSCPICHQLMQTASLEDRSVVYCTQCRGVLVRNSDFSEIVKRRRAAFDGQEDTPRPLDSDELQRELRCPRCERRMETHPYYGPGNAVVDTCAHCHLIWLDHGELALIERAPGRR